MYPQHLLVTNGTLYCRLDSSFSHVVFEQTCWKDEQRYVRGRFFR
jgi:hypothetical protein